MSCVHCQSLEMCSNLTVDLLGVSMSNLPNPVDRTTYVFVPKLGLDFTPGQCSLRHYESLNGMAAVDALPITRASATRAKQPCGLAPVALLRRLSC